MSTATALESHSHALQAAAWALAEVACAARVCRQSGIAITATKARQIAEVEIAAAKQASEDTAAQDAELRRHFDDLVAAQRVGDHLGMAAAVTRMTPGMDRISPAVRVKRKGVAA